MIQCKACPWRRDVVPERDIPGGYCAKKHAALRRTIAAEGDIRGHAASMACHESPAGAERECVGWVLHQLGPGNNLRLRLAALDGRYAEFRTVGPQHDRFEDTLPRSG